MRLRASVKPEGMSVRHVVAISNGDRIVDEVGLPRAKLAEIVEDPSGFFLLRFDAGLSPLGDTWHESLAEAKQQALVELGIDQEEWIAVES